MRVHIDHRRVGFWDIFADAGLPGDVNVVILKRGEVCGWHKHQRQTDRFFVVDGTVRFGMAADAGTCTMLDRTNADGVLVVPPGMWHGYMALEDDAIVLQFNDQHYTPDDEAILSWRAFGAWHDE